MSSCMEQFLLQPATQYPSHNQDTHFFTELSERVDQKQTKPSKKKIANKYISTWKVHLQ